MKNNLTKKEIRTIKTKDLNIRYCRILERADLLDADQISVSDAREILYIEDVLRERLIKVLGRDPYLPDCIEKKHPSNYMTSLLNRNKVKLKVEAGIKIKFKITIKSSIGSIIKEKNVYVDSRNEADLLALKEIRKLGLKKATYKLS